MADNWLENKEAALRSGRAVYRKDNPSLEQLLRRVAAGTAADAAKGTAAGAAVPDAAKGTSAGSVAGAAASTASVDASYVVKAAQLQAIIRAAAIIEPGVSAIYEEGAPAVIRCSSLRDGVCGSGWAVTSDRGTPEDCGSAACGGSEDADVNAFCALARFSMTAQLKAAELSLSTRITADGAIEVFKALPEK